MEGEFLAVVQEEQRTAVLDAVMLRADAQLVSDAIFCAHEFGSLLVSEFICIFDILGSGRTIYCCRHLVGDIALV